MRSVEVMRLRFDSCMRQRRKARGLYVNHVILILQRPFDKKKLAARDYQAVLFINIRRHDHVGDSRLVFHGDKNETLRGPWAWRAMTQPAARTNTPLRQWRKSSEDKIPCERSSARR